MKGELALSMVLVMLLLLMNSFLHLVQIEPISNLSQISDNTQPSSTNFHHKVNEKKNIGDQNCAAENPKEESIQEEIGEDQTQNENENYNQAFEKTLQDETPPQNANYTSPPDGRIYLTEDEPYPYTPTQTPKGWGNLPVQPPKMED